MLKNRKFEVRHFLALIAIIIAILGFILFLLNLLEEPKVFLAKGLQTLILIMIVELTNLACYPFVVAYWIMSGKPKKITILLILQTTGLVLFAICYMMIP